MHGYNGRFVCHAEGKTVPPRRGTSPEGAEGVSRPQEHNTGRIYGQNGSEKVKITLVHGKPLRPYGPPPLQGGGVFLRTDKLFVALAYAIMREGVSKPARRNCSAL